MSKSSSVPARRRRTRAQWQRIVSAQAASGLSQQAYCRRHKLPYSSFCHWKRELGSPVLAPVSGAEPVFVELTPAAAVSGSGWAFELDLGDGVYLRLRRS